MSSHARLPPARTGNGKRVVRAGILGTAVGIAIVSVIVATAYERPKPTPEPTPPGMKAGKDYLTLEPNAPQWSVISTKTPDPAEPRWTDPVPARVVFDESRTSRLGAPLAGRVSAVFVERGQTVKAGAPLYAVSSPNVAELQSAVKLAEVERDTAQKDYERTKTAVDAQVLPGKELVAAKQKLDQANVAYRAAQQKVASLKVSAGDAAFTVSAPRDGVVVEKSVALGQTVSPDSGSLVAIADLSDVWVVADIFGAHVATLAPGMKARVVIGAAGETDREATVDQVSAVVDPDRHGVPIRIKMDNSDGLLRPNAYVQVRLFDATPTVAMLPASAVMSDGQKSFVYIENPAGTFKRRDIVVGSVINGRVPVTSGLTTTDRVVVQGAILLDNEIALDN
jgi:RND family efflux transporter MFP subunit